MSSRIIKLFNNHTDAIFVRGDQILPGEYYTVPQTELSFLINDELLFSDISTGKLLVNDGANNIINSVEGWGWLIGNNAPPKSSEGYWSVTNKSESLLDGNQTVNWVSNRFLDSLSEYSETFIIPNNKTFVFTLFGTDSPNVSVFSTVEFYQYMNDEEYFRISPNIDPSNVWVFKSVSSADSSTGTAEITYNNYIDNQNLPVSAIYAVTPVSGENSVIGYIKINDIDTSANTILFSAFSSFDFQPNARIGLVDRYITALGTDSNTATVTYNSPLTFTGNGKNFLKLTVRNTHSTDAGFAGATVNGFLKPNMGSNN